MLHAKPRKIYMRTCSKWGVRRILPVLLVIGAFAAGFVILFAAQFGVSAITSSIWIVPGLVLTVVGAIGLMPSMREPEQRAALFLLYGSLVALLFIWSAPPPARKTVAELTIALALPILYVTGVVGLLLWGPRFFKSGPARRLTLALAMGVLVVYFSGSSGGTGGGSWERWLAAHLGVSLHTAEILVIAFRKTIHFSFYGLLALAAYGAAKADKAKKADAIGMALCIALSHSLFDEIRQAQTPDRTGQISDVLIDMLGAAVFIWLGSRTHKQPAKRRNV
jgi:VanZ family protein